MSSRRFFILVWLFSLITVPAANAQIDNLTNMSAEWIRMSNRNAATDAPDTVIFNPAGTVSLSEGFHLGIGNQFLFRMPEHSFADTLGSGRLSYEQDSPDLFVPNVCAVYTRGKWAVFGGIHVPGGGATLDYPDGSYTTRLIGLGAIADIHENYGVLYTDITDEKLKADSMYIATTVGGAYKVTDRVSVAAGVRCINAKNSIKGRLALEGDGLDPMQMDVDVDQSDTGWGGIFSVQAMPTDDMTVALRYETRVKLDLKNDVNSDDVGLFVDNERNRRDFPAMMGLGASYMVTPTFRCEADFNWFFQKDADWGTSADGGENATDAGNVWSIGAAAAYQVSPELEVSTGFLYTKHDWTDLDAYYNNNLGAIEVLYSTNVNLSAGFAYRVNPYVKLNCGVAYTIWDDEDINTPIGVVATENDTFLVGLGIDIAIPCAR